MIPGWNLDKERNFSFVKPPERMLGAEAHPRWARESAGLRVPQNKNIKDIFCRHDDVKHFV
jgi:hypothetical protein